MIERAAGGPLVHGFLFADLRGYTADAEAHGDAWAAELLDRYRVIVRGVLDELGGAEIRTEGDSFYVVFASASQAVAAGLAIVARATEATAAEPDRPIRVGVGIHAGEAEERADGYVGTAVNLAARVCARAAPGEVLVTDTVRGLVRTSGRYAFSPRGRPTLKGIGEPIALYRVDDAAATTAPIRAGPNRRTDPSARRSIVFAAVLVLVVGGAAVLAWRAAAGGPGPAPSSLAGGSGSPAAGSSPSAAAAAGSGATALASPTSPVPSGPQPFTLGRLVPGTYSTSAMRPALTFTVGDGWNAITELPNFVEIDRFGDDSLQLAFITPSVGYEACTTDHVALPTKRDALLTWLRGDAALSTTLVGPVSLGGIDAIEVDVGLGTGCGADQARTPQPLFLIRYVPNGFPDTEDRWIVTEGPASPIYLIDAGDGTTVVAMIGAPPSKLAAFVPQAKSVIATLEVGD